MKKALFFLVIGSVLLAACGSSNSATTANPTVPAEYAGKTSPLGADAATAGDKVFQTNCASCHGPQGHGDGAAGAALDPKPRNLSEFAPGVADDYLFWRINTGVPNTAMPPWNGILTEEQIWQAIAFIRTMKP
ncbi:MAG: c-type cytochrome [Anaerolineales bacterium]|nr:c-type cytochrome [Anaerolineales bacterium]